MMRIFEMTYQSKLKKITSFLNINVKLMLFHNRFLMTYKNLQITPVSMALKEISNIIINKNRNSLEPQRQIERILIRDKI